MAYNKPAVQVYQELLNAGGAANISPDLPACIVGPAGNVVTLDLTNALARAQTLAGSLTTLGNAEITLEVNAGSAKTAQIIDTASVGVQLRNPMVRTYTETGVDIAAGVVTIATNGVGPAGSNTAIQPTSFDPSVNHINVGDVVQIIDVAGAGAISQSFVTAVTSATGFTVASDTTLTGATVNVFHKFSSSVATTDGWDSTAGNLTIGGLTSETIPAGSAPSDAYAYFAEAEVNGFGNNLEVHIGYKAERTDLVGQILTINDTTDLENILGTADPYDNQLAFGVEIALSNSGGAPIYAITTDPDPLKTELVAHTEALELAEAQLLYWLVPLTTTTAVQAAYKAHADAMSLPSSGNWRVALLNQAIPTVRYILGRPDGADVDGDGIPDNMIPATLSGSSILLSTGDVGTVGTGDNLYITVSDGNGGFTTEAAIEVNSAAGNLIVLATLPTTAAGQVFIYVERTAEKQDQAQTIADQSATYSDKRIYNFPGNVRVNTAAFANAVVPGYFLMCAVAGLGSGLPAQNGITNITVAGISGLEHGNFYFSENQLNLMAQFGTMLFVQESQSTTPYCRHGLSTDVSVLEYRELLKVKNWDYLSYYYKNILAPFIGTWNITPDTLNTIRQTIISASETLLGRKLPKVGPPLLSYSINRLIQDPNNADAIIVDIQIAIVSPNNYTNVYLQI